MIIKEDEEEDTEVFRTCQRLTQPRIQYTSTDMMNKKKKKTKFFKHGKI
jgi:hypothetical protein